MNRYRFAFFAFGITLIVGLASRAQQSTTTAGAAANRPSREEAGLPSVEAQLKVLTDKLSLTGEQQDKIKPILKELHESTEKLAQDKSLSHEERLAKVRPQRQQADAKIRVILNDDQKKKLDQYEQGPHPEMHGNLSGSASAPES